MPRAPNENIEKAKELFDQGKKMVEISAALNVPEGTIRSWKKRYNWDCNVANKKRNVANKNNEKRVKRKTSVPEVESVVNNPDLTDKQRLFCLYYSKSFNATRSYQKAYGCSYETAMVEGHGHLRNPKIKDEILHLKQERYVRSFISEEDIFQKYWDIAFSDITDFLSFGRREVQVMGMYGPVEIKDEDGNKVPLMKEVNAVEFRDSSEIDGSILIEVKQGKDGASIKLADRMKALQWLSDHMDLATTEQQARISKINTEVAKMSDGGESFEDDGFLEALSGKIGEVWEVE